jgi:hypothetical protein
MWLRHDWYDHKMTNPSQDIFGAHLLPSAFLDVGTLGRFKRLKGNMERSMTCCPDGCNIDASTFP